MKILPAILAALALLAAYLFAWPTGMAPVAWTAPPPPKGEGPYEPNEKLAATQRLGRGVGFGPATIALDAVGQVYTGYDDGRVVVFTADGATYTEIGETGGRPLGITFGPRGGLVIADADRGLFHLGAKLKSLETGALKFASDIDNPRLDKNVYFTDRSTKFGRRRAATDLLEHGGSGRLLRYNFDTNAVSVLITGLHSPDGVAVGPDDDYVLVAETGEYRVLRYWLRGDRVGQHEVFIDNLPGLPAKLSYNDHGMFWLALSAPRSPQLDELLSGHFFARQLYARLPGSWLRDADRAWVLGLDLSGRVVASAQSAGPSAYAPITAVRERGPWLYFGSDGQDSIGRLALNNVLSGAPTPPPLSDRVPVPQEVKRAAPSREEEEEEREEAAGRGRKE